MPNPETALTNRIRSTILDRWPSAWVFKVHGGPYQTVGVPDLLACIDGQLFGLEVKCPRPGETDGHARGRATLSQLHQIDLLNAAGAVAAVVLSPEEAVQVISRKLSNLT